MPTAAKYNVVGNSSQMGQVLNAKPANEEYYVCIGRWLSNRTLRGFLANYTECVWPEVVKSLCMIAVYTLQYPYLRNSPHGDLNKNCTTQDDSILWTLEELMLLINYVEEEGRWPVELNPRKIFGPTQTRANLLQQNLRVGHNN